MRDYTTHCHTYRHTGRATAAAAGRDSFLLGPTGYGYFHPGKVDDVNVVQSFVDATARDAAALDMQAFIFWDDYHQPRRNQAYVRRFSGTAVRSVFSPVLPYMPLWLTDELTTFAEQYRWFADNSTSHLAEFLNQRTPRGRLGYVHKIFDVPYERVEALAAALQPHVQLVGHRELAQVAALRRKAGCAEV